MAKVLIIEDDIFLNELYVQTFRYGGFEVEQAKNGAEGVFKTKIFKPELIFLDIMMPKMNGLQVLDALKADDETKDIPIVILSNLSDERQATDAMKKGALTFVIKSQYDPMDITQMATDILAKLHPSQA